MDKPLWGLKVLKFDGAIAPRVLKFDSGYAAEGCGGRLIDKPLWGLRVDGPLGRRFLRGLSLTRLWREGCCRAPLNYRRRPFMIKPLQPPCGCWKCIPLWWLAPPPSPRRGDFILRYALSEGIALRNFILPPLAGEVRRTRIRGRRAQRANQQNAYYAL